MIEAEPSPSTEDSVSINNEDDELASREKSQHLKYLLEFRTQKCEKFAKHVCTQHRPYTCFEWHFFNQRRRKPVLRKDGAFNYNPDNYCTLYDDTTGNCPNNDSCPYVHRTAGDTERRYHPRYYKTATCVHDTDPQNGHCSRNGPHCAFAHGNKDLREPVTDSTDYSTSLADGPSTGVTAASAIMVGKSRHRSQGSSVTHSPHTPGACIPAGLSSISSLVSGSNQDDVVVDDKRWEKNIYVLAYYKTSYCSKEPRMCRQGFACPAYHNNKDKRRSPLDFRYKSNPCPQVKHDDWGDPSHCKQGDSCQMCHTRTEQQFHPEVFKTTRCNDMLHHNKCPRGPFCAFSHNDKDGEKERSLFTSAPSTKVKETVAEELARAGCSTPQPVTNGAIPVPPARNASTSNDGMAGSMPTFSSIASNTRTFADVLTRPTRTRNLTTGHAHPSTGNIASLSAADDADLDLDEIQKESRSLHDSAFALQPDISSSPPSNISRPISIGNVQGPPGLTNRAPFMSQSVDANSVYHKNPLATALYQRQFSAMPTVGGSRDANSMLRNPIADGWSSHTSRQRSLTTNPMGVPSNLNNSHQTNNHFIPELGTSFDTGMSLHRWPTSFSPRHPHLSGSFGAAGSSQKSLSGLTDELHELSNRTSYTLITNVVAMKAQIERLQASIERTDQVLSVRTCHSCRIAPIEAISPCIHFELCLECLTSLNNNGANPSTRRNISRQCPSCSQDLLTAQWTQFAHYFTR